MIYLTFSSLPPPPLNNKIKCVILSYVTKTNGMLVIDQNVRKTNERKTYMNN